MPCKKGNRDRLVLALGGNACGNTPQEQIMLVQDTAQNIVDLIEEDYDVVVTHGNGPQVGMIKSATDFAAQNGAETPEIPLPECGAMSQGYIGYHMQQAILRQLKKRNILKGCASVVTQTVVDQNDPAFGYPTKPIGAFYTEEEARAKAEETGYEYKEDAGRGWRQVVASPKPQRIVEFDVICDMINAGYVVVCAGGGGVPVIEQDNSYSGIPAVIDKDWTAAKLAIDSQADMLVILTAVEKVAINFGKPYQQDIDTMTVSEAKRYIEEGQFPAGSMLPKVEACINFVEHYPQGKALITSLESAAAGLRGETGTIITA